MPFDGAVLYSVVSELKDRIINGKIEKIYQPEKDALILNIRTYKETHKLLLSASPMFPRVNFTNENKQNPLVPPTFCMLLRKHLTGGRVISVVQPNMERIVEITFECIDEMGYSTRKSIITEIMGRHSNIIFIDDNSKKIIDSIKRVNFQMSSVREILPGKEYIYPPSGDKQNPLIIDKDSFIESINNLDASIKPDKYFINRYNGISPALAKEIAYLASIDTDTDLKACSPFEAEKLYNAFASLLTPLKQNSFTPNIVIKDSQPFDFSCLALSIYSSYEQQVYPSISETIEHFYDVKDSKDRIKQKASDIYRIITPRLDRCYKKSEVLHDELEQAQNSTIYKVYGDLLTSNLHTLEKGQKEANLVNFYSENSELITIPLDNQLTPIANAQKYYKQYNKSKTALKIIDEQLNENKQEIQYLESQLDNLDKCTEELEIQEIRNELGDMDYIKRKKAEKQKQQKASKPMHFVSSGGFDIYVGKNNIQNDNLTLKFAASNDTWLHTKDIPGSHVIIHSNGQAVDDATLYEAANLAAFYSKGKMSSKVPVDYALKKYVKKPNGAKPGMVIYENNKTIYLTPDENKINEMKKQ